MIFNEALKELRNGKYVTRQKWADNDGKYLALLPNMLNIWQLQPPVNSTVNGAAGTWVPFAEDLDSNDWVKLEDLKPKNENVRVVEGEVIQAA